MESQNNSSLALSTYSNAQIQDHVRSRGSSIASQDTPVPTMHTSMDKHEVPTAPPSPKTASVVPHISPYRASSLPRDAQTSKSSQGIITAGRTRCTVCHIRCHKMMAQMRDQHMNGCWQERSDLANAEQRVMETAVSAAQKITEESSSFDQDDYPSTEGDSISDNESSNDEERLGEASLSDDEGGNEDVPPAEIPPSACVFCFKDLERLGAVDAYDHRARCLLNHQPDFCPICDLSFRTPTRWLEKDIMWHLHKCQHGLELTDEDSVSYTKLHDAWTGRFVLVRRVMQEKSTVAPGKRVQNFKKKKEKSLTIGTGRYYSGH